MREDLWYDPVKVREREMAECSWIDFLGELMCPDCHELSGNYYVHHLNHSHIRGDPLCGHQDSVLRHLAYEVRENNVEKAQELAKKAHSIHCPPDEIALALQGYTRGYSLWRKHRKEQP